MNVRIRKALDSFKRKMHANIDASVEMIGESVSAEFEAKNPKDQEAMLYDLSNMLSKDDGLDQLQEKIQGAGLKK